MAWIIVNWNVCPLTFDTTIAIEIIVLQRPLYCPLLLMVGSIDRFILVKLALENFVFGEDQLTWALAAVIIKISFVYAAVFIVVNSISLLLTILKRSFVWITWRIFYLSVSMRKIVLEFPIDMEIFVLVLSNAIKEGITKISFTEISIFVS